MGKLEEKIIRIGRKGVTTLPKALRQAAGIVEGGLVRAKVLPFGILVRPLISNPVESLEKLSTRRKEGAVKSVRRLREKIDSESRKNRR